MLMDAHISSLMNSVIDLSELQTTLDCSVSDVSGWILVSVIGFVYPYITRCDMAGSVDVLSLTYFNFKFLTTLL